MSGAIWVKLIKLGGSDYSSLVKFMQNKTGPAKLRENNKNLKKIKKINPNTKLLKKYLQINIAGI